jgi:adenosylcobinamide amidohydrolase
MVSQGYAAATDGNRGALWWRFGETRPALSSASVGGGLLEVDWVLNIGVVHDYRRTDLDAHAAELAGPLDLRGAGAALFTAADVDRVATATEAGVQAWATVGVTRPTWPADRTALPLAGRRLPGTINTVVVVDARLTASALVQAALSATEAKAQACVEAGVAGTGTASDALVLVGAATGPAQEFGGVRSVWGSRVALAVHAAVARGLGAR